MCALGPSARDVIAGLAMPPPELEKFFAGFRSRHTIADVERLLEEIRGLRVLVVGEAIIDEYVYCETMGKAGKEPILAARFIRQEQFVGGILAIANHISAMANSVTAVTFVGDDGKYDAFLRERMADNVELFFLPMAGAPTICKRRYIESYPLQKLFEVYVMGRRPSDDPHQSAALEAALKRMVPEFDVVIVADYGHGMIHAGAVDILCEQARFLAVNTQMNADNRGFNTVSKYPRADFVSASETEIRLEARSRERDLREIVLEVATLCTKLLITRGSRGSLYYDGDEGFVDVPAFTSHTVDRVGAGDAVLAVTALCAAKGAPAEMVAAIGNAVGAQAVGTVGNSSSVDRGVLVREFATLLS